MNKGVPKSGRIVRCETLTPHHGAARHDLFKCYTSINTIKVEKQVFKPVGKVETYFKLGLYEAINIYKYNTRVPNLLTP